MSVQNLNWLAEMTEVLILEFWKENFQLKHFQSLDVKEYSF